MSYEITGHKVFCGNDASKCILDKWIGDKGVSIYRCPNCRQSYRVNDNEFIIEPEERNEDV